MSPVVKVLKPKGILDNNKSTALRQQVEDSIKEGNNIIVIDLKRITFMDSSGLGTLIIIRRIVNEKNGKLFLMSLNEQVKILLFELTNTAQYFDIVDDETELKAKLSS